MLSFVANDRLPGFRVGVVEDPPGFRMAPDGSVLGSSAATAKEAPGDSWIPTIPWNVPSDGILPDFLSGFPQRSRDAPAFPSPDIQTADYCSRVIANCKDRCAGIYADKGGSLGFPWMRKCIRDCVTPTGCVY
jgi:hypothetical protein